MRGKKFAVCAAAAALCASMALFGCSSEGSGQPEGSDAESQQAKQAEQKYQVTIDDCVVTQDYEGNPAAAVYYTWTNNSEEATSFAVAVRAQAFQNGVELENAVLMDVPEGYEAGATMKEVKPGGTVSVQMAYVLADESEVSVECSEMFAMDDSLLAEASFAVA